MKNRIEDAITVAKTYWTIINHLLYYEKTPAIQPLLVYAIFGLEFN